MACVPMRRAIRESGGGRVYSVWGDEAVRHVGKLVEPIGQNKAFLNPDFQAQGKWHDWQIQLPIYPDVNI